MLRYFRVVVYAELAAVKTVESTLGKEDGMREDDQKRETKRHRPGAPGGYVSEFEQFLDNYIAQHPEVEEDQMRGWYIWWDHKQDIAERAKERRDSVAVKPYSYE